MWLMVMFDLPVGKQTERAAAAKFRNFLLDQGFQMSQFSVYVRCCSGKEQVETYQRRIERNMPKAGKVNLLAFTDKQYENIICFRGTAREPSSRNPEQFILF